ncbi:MAG: hypothetical protein P3T54_08245 [Dehalogenimonas sp.]|uniref:DUF3784 domain-containing protein n=1 Tax=Candidatus Dehalogenimonas loeffleri TaxID=3127115 RepID=A0ABZ2J410_9CHLR|nr:hypothetical protein [Dehalogenimonas sp.]
MDTESLLIPIGIIFLISYGSFIIYWYVVKREKFEWVQVDERIEVVINKSARNAFGVTWLTMFIFVDFKTPTATSLLIVVASGLAVLIFSYYWYLFNERS